MHEPDSEFPYVCNVAVPDGQGKFYIYKYVFREMRRMFEMAQTYYFANSYNPDAVKAFHFKTVKDYEIQPELPFAKWHDRKSGESIF